MNRPIGISLGFTYTVSIELKLHFGLHSVQIEEILTALIHRVAFCVQSHGIFKSCASVADITSGFGDAEGRHQLLPVSYKQILGNGFFQ